MNDLSESLPQPMYGRGFNRYSVKVVSGKELANGALELTVNLTVQPGPQPSNFSSGENTRYLTMIQENGSWKIDNIATSPSK